MNRLTHHRYGGQRSWNHRLIVQEMGGDGVQYNVPEIRKELWNYTVWNPVDDRVNAHCENLQNYIGNTLIQSFCLKLRSSSIDFTFRQPALLSSSSKNYPVCCSLYIDLLSVTVRHRPTTNKSTEELRAETARKRKSTSFGPFSHYYVNRIGGLSDKQPYRSRLG
jgi:hypothetical protein